MNTAATWQSLKKWSKRGVITFLVLYILLTMDSLFSTATPSCPIERHTFEGQTFDVELCYDVGQRILGLGFGVYSTEGKLLAWRSSTFDPESRLNYLAIDDSMIRYSDSPMDRINPPADCVLNMPPTWLDWLEARLPGGIPGLSHCGSASLQVVDKAQAQWEDRIAPQRVKEEQASRDNQAYWRARAAATAVSPASAASVGP